MSELAVIVTISPGLLPTAAKTKSNVPPFSSRLSAQKCDASSPQSKPIVRIVLPCWQEAQIDFLAIICPDVKQHAAIGNSLDPAIQVWFTQAVAQLINVLADIMVEEGNMEISTDMAVLDPGDIGQQPHKSPDEMPDFGKHYETRYKLNRCHTRGLTDAVKPHVGPALGPIICTLILAGISSALQATWRNRKR